MSLAKEGAAAACVAVGASGQARSQAQAEERDNAANEEHCENKLDTVFLGEKALYNL